MRQYARSEHYSPRVEDSSSVRSSFFRVPTQTGKPGKPGKMGRHFPVGEKSGNFEQTGKVREKSGKITQNTGKHQGFSEKCYVIF